MNVVFIFSDQHNPWFSGCYGNPISRTPNIDRIAADGIRFENAYCPSPLCAPTRAAMFAGRYAHEIGCWDNAIAWRGTPYGWGHYFRDNDVQLTTVGKLDFQRGHDHGIEQPLIPHYRDSYDIHSLFREQEIVPRYNKWQQMQGTGPRDDFPEEIGDDHVMDRSIEWLRNERPADRPWVLNVNYVNPHPGWATTQELWDHYDPLVKLKDLPNKYFEAPENLHPFHRAFARHQCGDIATREEIRRGHVGYHCACDRVDQNVGGILNTLEELGILDETLVIYASDHGETCRAHASWGKMVMYEDSIRIPVCIMGPGIAPGRVENSPVSQMDLFPTICQAVGLPVPERFRGISLMGQLHNTPNARRNYYAFSEYHANGFPGGAFAIRSGQYKFVECVGERPMLFDLDADPQELHDLVVESPDDPATQATISRMRRILHNICSPEAVDTRAKADQRAFREKLNATGQLAEEMYKRGYEKTNTNELITRKEILPADMQ